MHNVIWLVARGAGGGHAPHPRALRRVTRGGRKIASRFQGNVRRIAGRYSGAQHPTQCHPDVAKRYGADISSRIQIVLVERAVAAATGTATIRPPDCRTRNL